MADLFGINTALQEAGKTIRCAMEQDTKRFVAVTQAETQKYEENMKLKAAQWTAVTKALGDFAKVAEGIYTAILNTNTQKAKIVLDTMSSSSTLYLALLQQVTSAHTMQFSSQFERLTYLQKVETRADEVGRERQVLFVMLMALVPPSDLTKVEKLLEDVQSSLKKLVKDARSTPPPPPPGKN